MAVATSPPGQAPRKVEPGQALPEPAIGATQAAMGGALSAPLATAAGVAAGVVATAPAVPIVKVTQETIEKILEGMRRFFVVMRARQERWIVEQGMGRLPQQDILDVIAEESHRQGEFQRKVMARVTRDLGKAATLPEEARAVTVDALLRRERVYARQRSEAMAVRALASLDRTVLRRTSPLGAFWKLDPTVSQHTPDCIAMGGKFWPWEVLDDFHPPTHAGCRCGLRGYVEAIAAGWMRVGEIPDLAVARRKAAAAKALLHEEDTVALREAVGRLGVAGDREFIDAWMEVA